VNCAGLTHAHLDTVRTPHEHRDAGREPSWEQRSDNAHYEGACADELRENDKQSYASAEAVLDAGTVTSGQHMANLEHLKVHVQAHLDGVEAEADLTEEPQRVRVWHTIPRVGAERSSGGDLTDQRGRARERRKLTGRPHRRREKNQAHHFVKVFEWIVSNVLFFVTFGSGVNISGDETDQQEKEEFD
jgi:hypothetical protein